VYHLPCSSPTCLLATSSPPCNHYVAHPSIHTHTHTPLHSHKTTSALNVNFTLQMFYYTQHTPQPWHAAIYCVVLHHLHTTHHPHPTLSQPLPQHKHISNYNCTSLAAHGRTPSNTMHNRLQPLHNTSFQPRTPPPTTATLPLPYHIPNLHSITSIHTALLLPTVPMPAAYTMSQRPTLTHILTPAYITCQHTGTQPPNQQPRHAIHSHKLYPTSDMGSTGNSSPKGKAVAIVPLKWMCSC
jgi:hypothetical protein